MTGRQAAEDPTRLSNEDCQAFLDRTIAKLRADDRFIGVLVAGSGIVGEMDRFSDLDLILVCKPEARDALMPERRAIAGSIGHLLAAFTGEHVGAPSLLICLYDDPLLHVDLKFAAPAELSSRVETPRIAWSKDEVLEAHLAKGSVHWPNMSPDWFEERFWIWVHYAAQKVGRGELFEAIDMLAYIRQQVLGPMNARNHARDQRGVRRVENFAPVFAKELRQTLCVHDKADIKRALRAAIAIYQDLRAKHPPTASTPRCEAAVRDHLERV
jgi:hypothetical protein